MVTYLQTFWSILLEISPFVILGMLAAGLVHEALGRFQRLRAFALKRNPWSLSFFNFSGFTLPICSCGIVPLAVGLRKQGVPFGNIFTFIYSAPATSIAAVILSLAVFGPDFTLYYVVGALLCGYVVGLVFYLLETRTTLAAGGDAVCLNEPSGEEASRHGFLMRAIRWGTLEYGSRIAFDLILGLALAALIVASYSVQDLGGWIGEMPFWQSAPLMILIALPLYICSLPGILVGGALVLGGFTPALLWVFLMAGPVTNLGDINVLRRNLGWRNTLVYVAVVVVSTLAWGWVIDLNLDWAELWGQVRQYYAAQAGMGALDGDIAGALSGSEWLGLPREAHYATAAMLVVLTLNGAWQSLKTLWLSPCRHCYGFQKDLHLSPAVCSAPCWKRRVLRLASKGLPTMATAHDSARDRQADKTDSSTR